MHPLERRSLLGALAALVAAPLALSRSWFQALARPAAEAPKPLDRPSVNPPSHSVKRRG